LFAVAGVVPSLLWNRVVLSEASSHSERPAIWVGEKVVFALGLNNLGDMPMLLLLRCPRL
jgi:hypothetical protein